MGQNDRIVMKLTEGGYQVIPFANLKKGNLFLLFNPDMTPVTFKDKELLIALSDASINDNGIGEIHMKDYDPETLH